MTATKKRNIRLSQANLFKLGNWLNENKELLSVHTVPKIVGLAQEALGIEITESNVRTALAALGIRTKQSVKQDPDRQLAEIVGFVCGIGDAINYTVPESLRAFAKGQ